MTSNVAARLPEPAAQLQKDEEPCPKITPQQPPPGSGADCLPGCHHALEALEKRVAAALRQMQQRHDTSLDEAVQLLVGQLWAAYFSIGSLQAHQQTLQAQVAELAAGGGGGGGAGPGGVPGAPAAPGMQPEGDSQEEETISASLSFSEDDPEVGTCRQHLAQQALHKAAPQRSSGTACTCGTEVEATRGMDVDGGGMAAAAPQHAALCQQQQAQHEGGRGVKRRADSGPLEAGDAEAAAAAAAAAAGEVAALEAALHKEKSKRRRLAREVRELRSLLELCLPDMAAAPRPPSSG